MLGASESYRAPEARSALDSMNGLSIKVVLKNGHEVPCKLDAGSARNLVRCVKCDLYTLKWARLICDHSLCERCFMQCQNYFCTLDKVMTMKFKAKSGSCQYAVLKDVLIKCLYCSEFLDGNTIAYHIEKEHSSLFVEESSGTPNAEQNKTEPCKTELCNSKVPHDHVSQSSNDRYTEILKRRQPMAPERLGDTKMEPDKICQDRITQCENYKRALPVTHFESQGSELREAERRNESVGNLGVKEEEDDWSEDKKLDDHIQELKAKIKVLEQRLEKIEKPLRKIIERLSKNQ